MKKESFVVYPLKVYFTICAKFDMISLLMKGTGSLKSNGNWYSYKLLV